MALNRLGEPTEEKFVSYHPPHFPHMPIDLTGGDTDESSDFSGSDDGNDNEHEIDSDTEETSDENSPEPRNSSKNVGGDSHSDGVEKNIDMASENRFLLALMSAAKSYSNRLRITAISEPDAPSPSQLPPTTITPHTIQLELSNDEDTEMEEFSDDEDSKDEYLPSLSAEEAAQLFYKPVGKWAEFAECPIENPVVISKLNAGAMCEASIKQGILGGRKITYVSKTWLHSQKWEGFFSEMTLYADPSYLRPLQGKVIPEIIGLYLVDGAISVAMELPSSTFWVEASEDMSEHLKRKCVAAFDEVHSCGVLHDDVELRHMLVSAAGEVTLIDFQMSRALKPKYEVGLQRATEAEFRLEKRKVLYKLDFDNAKWKENAKRTRVMSRRERNDERRRRRKLLPSGTKPGPDDEYELDDRDDVINPIVGDMDWLRLWVGDEFDPSCYVVPGQDEQKVDAMLKDFAMREILRLEEEEKEKEERLRRTQINMSTAVSTSHHRPTNTRSLSSSTSSSQKAITAPTQTESLEAAVLKDEDNESENRNTPSTHSPVLLPMRVCPTPSRGTKRPRDSTEDDINCSKEGDAADTNKSDLPPAQKKRITDSVAGALESSGSSTFPTATLCVPTVTTTSSSSAPSTEDSSVRACAPGSFSPSSSSLTQPSVFPFLEERNFVNVPYDNYNGESFKLPNIFGDEDLAEGRRHWIRQDNMRQFLKEGFVHPADELYEEIAIEIDSELDETNIGKNKRKRKGVMGRGALKRFKRELEAPGKAKLKALRRKEQYFKDRALELGWDPEEEGDLFSDSDGDPEEQEDIGYDNIPEGPRILTWAELEARKAVSETERSSLGSQAIAPEPAFTLTSGSDTGLAGPSGASTFRSIPRKGILRRQLTVKEKFDQRAYEKTLLLTGRHPNQLNIIDEEDSDSLNISAPQGCATSPRPTVSRRPSSTELPPLMKAYTKPSEVVAVSASTSKAKANQSAVAIKPQRYTSALPASQMFAPGAQAKAILTTRTRRPTPVATNSLAKKRIPRTPAASFCAFTGAYAKFPPSPTRVSLPPFPAAALSGGTRAFTIPYSSSLHSTAPPFPAFPTTSIVSEAAASASRSILAQARQAGSSGSNVTMEDLSDGSHIGNDWSAPEPSRPGAGPSSATEDGQAPPSNSTTPGLGSEELIGAIATVPIENNGLESEDEELNVHDSSAIANISLSSHIQSLAKTLFPWLR